MYNFHTNNGNQLNLCIRKVIIWIFRIGKTPENGFKP